MNKFEWILALFSIFISISGTAKDRIDGFKNFRSLTIEDGLPSNTITCFAKDSSGFMWMGTDNGLVRYDGSEIIVFQHNEEDITSLSGNNISDIQLEGDSILWVATLRNGLSRFRLETKTCTRYAPVFGDSTSLASQEILSLDRAPDGTLWVGFHREGFGIYNHELDNFTNFNIPLIGQPYQERQNDIVLKIIFDNQNPVIVWLLTLKNLVRFNNITRQFDLFNPYENLGDKKAEILYSIRNGIQSKNGKIYLTMQRYGVWSFDPKNRSWKNYSLREYNPINRLENSYNLISERDERSFWLSSHDKGMFILNLDLGFIEPLENCEEIDAAKLCTQRIVAMSMHEEEGYWISTNNGLRLYNKIGNQFNIFTHQPDRETLQNRATITSIYQVDNRGVYFGGYAGEGLYFLDLNTKTKEIIPPPEKYSIGKITEMFNTRAILPFDDYNLLVLSDNALFKLDIENNRLTEVDIGLIYHKDYYYFHRIFLNSKGNYYLSTRHNGIYILNPELKCIGQLNHDKHNQNSLISSNYIYEICEDPMQRLWIGTEDGFSVYDPKDKTYDNFSYKERLDSIPQLKIIIKIACAPDSSIWIIDGRGNSVSVDYPYTKPFQFKPVATGKNGKYERINNVLFGKDGKTYISCPSGLSILDESNNIEVYNEKEGLPKLYPLGAMYQNDDGQLFLASSNKLIHFFPEKLIQSSNTNPLYLTAITILNREHIIYTDSLQNAGLTLNYSQNFFSLRLSTINYNNPEEYKLSYRLLGLNDAWITSTNREAVFTNIDGGKYTFEARLLDKYDQPLPARYVLPLKIIPPFWQTWWFKLLSILFVVIIGATYYLIRVRSIQREAALTMAFNKRIANMELTTLRAQMNPHFLFNSLNSIRYQILTNQKEEADRYLLKFSRLVRLILNNSRQQLIYLKDELEALALYIELESSRFDHKFTYELKIEDSVDIEHLKIPPILIQPFVENAIWHGLMQKSSAGKVMIDIKKTDKLLIIKVEDDGIGREKAKELKSKTAEKRQSMGIEITGNRLEIIEKIYGIECRAELIDLKNEAGEACGTAVFITLPLIYED